MHDICPTQICRMPRFRKGLLDVVEIFSWVCRLPSCLYVYVSMCVSAFSLRVSLFSLPNHVLMNHCLFECMQLLTQTIFFRRTWHITCESTLNFGCVASSIRHYQKEFLKNLLMVVLTIHIMVRLWTRSTLLRNLEDTIHRLTRLCTWTFLLVHTNCRRACGTMWEQSTKRMDGGRLFCMWCGAALVAVLIFVCACIYSPNHQFIHLSLHERSYWTIHSPVFDAAGPWAICKRKGVITA